MGIRKLESTKSGTCSLNAVPSQMYELDGVIFMAHEGAGCTRCHLNDEIRLCLGSPGCIGMHYKYVVVS